MSNKNPKEQIEAKIFCDDSYLSTLNNWRKNGEKVVFTNGCFDVIHKGHLENLLEVASYGSKLVLGLNTDSSVRKLKGAERPIVEQNNRAFLLASLAYVDMVILFEESTPVELLKKVRPDIMCKGSDYIAEELPGYDIVTSYGGEVVLIPLLEGFSSTDIIQRIKNLS